MRNRSTSEPATTWLPRFEHQPLSISSDEEILNRVADYMDWLNGTGDPTSDFDWERSFDADGSLAFTNNLVADWTSYVGSQFRLGA